MGAPPRMIFILIVLLTVATPFLSHVVVARLFRGFRTPEQRQKGVIISVLLGALPLIFLATLHLYLGWRSTVETMPDFTYLLLLYGAAAYVYFHFFNMSETSRRIWLLVSSDRHTGAVGPNIDRNYNPTRMLGNRLGRLVSLGEIAITDGKYRIDRGRLVAPARGVMFLRALLFPTALPQSPSWPRVFALIIATLALAAFESTRQPLASLSPAGALPVALLGGVVGCIAYLLLSPRHHLGNYLLAATPFLFVTFGFLTSPDIPGRDSFWYHFPFFQFFAESFASGAGLPTWLPSDGGMEAGFYHINNFPFLPSRIIGYTLFALLPITAATAYKAQLIIGVLLFSWGWYAVVAEITKSQKAAFLATLCITLGGTGMAFDQEQVIASCHLLPWFILCLLKIHDRPAFLLPAAALFGLGLSTHYPQIQIIVMGLSTLTVMLWRRPNLAYAGPILRKFAPWMALLVVVGSIPALNIWYHSGGLATRIRGTDHLRPISYTEYAEMNSKQNSSALPWYFNQYLRPEVHKDLDQADANGLFVGRVPLLLAVLALLLRPAIAIPIAVLLLVFAELSLGINSHLDLPRLLFAARFPFIDVFRQWYHFFPFINFCFSLLAAVGIHKLHVRYRSRPPTPRNVLIVALIFISIADLAYNGLMYLGTWCNYTPLPPEQRRLLQATYPETPLFQYKDRFNLIRATPAAIPPADFITTDYLGTAAGLESERALLAAPVIGHRVVTDRPTDSPPTGTPWASETTAEIRPWGAIYRVDIPTRALLVTTINYSLGATARVDDLPVQVRRVNTALSGVILEPGRHEVRFEKEGWPYAAIMGGQCAMYLFIGVSMFCLLL